MAAKKTPAAKKTASKKKRRAAPKQAVRNESDSERQFTGGHLPRHVRETIAKAEQRAAAKSK